MLQCLPMRHKSVVRGKILDVGMQLHEQVVLQHPYEHLHQLSLLRRLAQWIALLCERRRQREVAGDSNEIRAGKRFGKLLKEGGGEVQGGVGRYRVLVRGANGVDHSRFGPVDKMGG